MTSTRGYAGHEMVDEVGLIHMNGRIYAATLGRFLQADPFIQSASDTQAYNRYAYVRNDPMNATDPSGFFLRTLGKNRFAMMVISAALEFVPGCTYWCSAVFNAAVGYATTGSLRGAFVGAVASYMSPAGYSFAAIMIRAYIGGVASVAMGGQFRNGAIAYAAAGGTVGKNATARIVTAAFIGGSVSVVTGGKFKNGAVTAAFGAAVSEGLQAGKNGNDRQLNGYEWDGASLEDPTVRSIVNAQKGSCPVDECMTVVGNALNVEEAGTVKYIGSSPNTDPVTGDTAEARQCFADTCTPGGVLAVTGGAEQYDAQGRLLLSKNSTHYPSNGGRAIDLSGWRNDNSQLTGQLVNVCALACGFTHGQWEKNHWHLQIGPVNGSKSLPMKER